MKKKKLFYKIRKIERVPYKKTNDAFCFGLNQDKSKYGRRQRSGIDLIKYHT